MASNPVEVDYALDQAYIVGPDDLSKINTAMREFLGTNAEVTFSALCSDDTTREFGDVSSIKKYENPPSGAILRLIIEGKSADLEKRVRISFDRGTYFSPAISVRITGSGTSTQTLRKKLEDIVDGITPWYAWIVRLNTVSCLVNILALLVTTMLLVVLTVLAVSNQLHTLKLNDSGSSFIVVGGFYAILIVLAIKLGQWKDAFFPKSVFTIGQGAERDGRLIAKRNFWLVVVVVGLIIGVVGGLLTTLLQLPVTPK